MISKKIKQVFFYANCEDEEEFQTILPMIHKHNFALLRVMSAISTIFLLMMVLISNFAVTGFIGLRNYYTLFFVLSLLIFIAQFYSSFLEQSSSFTLIYAYAVLMFAFGIMVGTMVGTSQTATSFIAIILLVPLVFIDRPIKTIPTTLLVVAAFLIMNYMNKTYNVFVMDMVNVLIYSFMSIVVNIYLTAQHAQRFLTTIQLHKISEIDVLTGLKNRNSFEQSLCIYQNQTKNAIGCIYVDVNGLHEINNTQGHAMGDKMLKFIAIELQKIFGKSDTYRIGGDEYAAFVVDSHIDNIESNMIRLNEIVEIQGYHIAIGAHVQYVGEIDISLLIKTAEEKMYVSKANYYSFRGIDRRKKRD